MAEASFRTVCSPVRNTPKAVCWLQTYLAAADTSFPDSSPAPSGAPNSLMQLACVWFGGTALRR